MANEIKPLTSARGVAACLVMVYHFHQLDSMPAPLLAFVQRGYIWVDFFFVLSGFVMAMTYSNYFTEGKRTFANYKLFLMRRVGRIYPLYLAVTLGVSFYSLIVYGGFEGVKRPAVNLENPLLAHITNVLMVQAWGFGASIGGPTWSISTEWAMYLLFPLLVWVCCLARPPSAMIMMCVGYGILCYVAITPEAEQSVRNGQLDVYHGKDMLPLLRCLGRFCLGLVAFRTNQAVRKITLLYSDGVVAGVLVLLVLALGMKVPDLATYPLLVLLVIGLYGNRGRVAQGFSTPLLYKLGVWSYSIYLIHYHCHVLLTQLQKRLPAFMPETAANLVAAVVTYGLIFVMAAFAHRFIEKPGRDWFRKLSG